MLKNPSKWKIKTILQTGSAQWCSSAPTRHYWAHTKPQLFLQWETGQLVAVPMSKGREKMLFLSITTQLYSHGPWAAVQKWDSSPWASSSCLVPKEAFTLHLTKKALGIGLLGPAAMHSESLWEHCLRLDSLNHIQMQFVTALSLTHTEVGALFQQGVTMFGEMGHRHCQLGQSERHWAFLQLEREQFNI